MLTDEEDNLIDVLEDKFGCHTVILYGSRAIGTHRPDSDWDVIGITTMGKRNFFHETVPNVGEVSAYIHHIEEVEFKPNALSGLYASLVDFVRLRYGKVLVQQDGIGDKIVALARRMYSEGPPPVTREWAKHFHYYFLDYGVGGLRNPQYDIMHKQIIRDQIMPTSMNLYFQIRNMWRPFPRDIFPYLKKANPKSAVLFQAAFAADATVDAIEQWLEHVLAIEQAF